MNRSLLTPRARSLHAGVLLVLLALLGLVQAAPARAIAVEQIPDPRPARWAVDLSGILATEARKTLDLVGGEVAARTGKELVVVVIGSTGGEDPRRVATRLFDAWEIGGPERRQGALLFVAVDDHAAEIVLGEGLASPSLAALGENIVLEKIEPLFRKGQEPAAVLLGALACANKILGAGIVPPLIPPRSVFPYVEQSPDAEPLPAAPPAPPRRAPAAGSRAVPPLLETVATILAVALLSWLFRSRRGSSSRRG